jgi:hypothetical protein
VWWWHRDAFEFPPMAAATDPQQRGDVRLGPAGGGPLRDLAAIEIAIARRPADAAPCGSRTCASRISRCASRRA